MVWSSKQGQVSPTQQILHGLQNSWIVELRLSPNSVAKLYPLPLCFEVNTSSRYALNALGPCLDVQFYFCHEILPPFEGEIAWGRLSDSKLLKIASRRDRIRSTSVVIIDITNGGVEPKCILDNLIYFYHDKQCVVTSLALGIEALMWHCTKVVGEYYALWKSSWFVTSLKSQPITRRIGRN